MFNLRRQAEMKLKIRRFQLGKADRLEYGAADE